MDEMELEHKYRCVQQAVSNLKTVLVAYSGGVDSTLALKVAKEALPRGVLAVTAVSPTMAAHELEDAIRLAEEMGVEHLLVGTDELEIPEFVQNPENKCYICKKHRFGKLVEMARQRGIHAVIDGENADDRNDYRPGSAAARELGVVSPLRDAAITKGEVRALSRKLGLSTWNKASYACLASRIPHWSPISAEKLQQIDAAEAFIRSLHVAYQVRVRHYGEMAVVEVESVDLPNLLEEQVRTSVTAHLKVLGFKRICLDLEGYRMGSLNPQTSRP